MIARRYWAVCALLMAMHGEALAGPPDPASSDAEFARLVQQGNRALAARRWDEAVLAYSNAKKLRDDLTVVGRLGLALLELREHVAAATQLYRTVEEPTAGTSNAERLQFFNGFRAARREVCRIDVTVDTTGARVTLDGVVIQEGPADFWVFLDPGPHELRATLDGFEEETQEITATPGGRMPVTFTLRPKRAAHVEPRVKVIVQQAPPSLPNATPPEHALAKPEKPPVRIVSSPNSRYFYLGVGPAFVIRATPGVALGPQISAGWRRDWFSIGLDTRVAWMLATSEAVPDSRYMSWAAGFAPCGHWRLLFGCAVLQVDGIEDSPLSANLYPSYRNTPRVGVGLRAGVDLALNKRFHLKIWGDALVRASGYLLSGDDKPIWQGTAYFGTFNASTVVIF